MAGPYQPTSLNNYVGIGKESVKGTGVAPSTWAAYVAAVDLDHNQQINRVKEAGQFGQNTYAEKISQIPSGGFEIMARPSSAGRLSAYLLGVDAIGSAVSGVYPHVIDEDMNTDYLSVEQNLSDEAIERFVDAALVEITFSVNRDSPTLRMKAMWAGGAPAYQASPTSESYEAENPWVLSEAAFTIDGSSVTNVIGFELDVKMLFSAERTSGVTTVYMVELGEEVTVSVDTILDVVNTGYREVNYGSTSGTSAPALPKTGAFVADFTRGSGATARELKLNIPNLDYDAAKYTALDPGGSEATKLTRPAVARKAAGTPFFEVTAKNLDNAQYV